MEDDRYKEKLLKYYEDNCTFDKVISDIANGSIRCGKYSKIVKINGKKINMKKLFE